MTHLWDQLLALGPSLWFVVAIALVALEMIVPGVHFMWFGIAAAIVGLAALVAGTLGVAAAFSWPWQIALFAVLAIATVFAVKRVAKPGATPTDAPDLNVRAEQYVGRLVVVEDAITSGRGRVRVGDTLWTAEGPDTPAGTRVTIKGVRGTVLVV